MSQAKKTDNDKTKRQTAKVFMSGPSQAVRIPQAYRFACDTVTIREEGGSLILTPVAESWDELCTGDPADIDDMLAAINDSDLQPLETRAALE